MASVKNSDVGTHTDGHSASGQTMLKLSAGLNSLDFCHDEQREALKRMEAISPGRWLDDIPPISAADSVQANRYSMLMDTDQKDPERRSLHNEKTKPDDHQTNPSVSRAHHHSLYSRTEQGVHRNRHRNSNSSLNPEKSDFGSDSLRRSHRTDSVSSSGSTSSGYRSPASLAVAEAYSGERLLPLATAIKVAMEDSSFSEQSSFDTSLVDMVALGGGAGGGGGEEAQSPTAGGGAGGGKFSFSRASSTGSIPAVSHSSASSAQNTDDDEDSDSTIKSALSMKDRRREAHTHAEQKRRDNIKRGYDELQNMIPTCQQQETVGSTKLSKAVILQKSIDYINYLVQQKAKQEDDLEKLRKEVKALRIMKENIEHMVKQHQNTPQHGQNQVSDEVKFQVFQLLMDNLFQSFDQSISVANFAELSGSIFRWLEESCKPQTLRDLTLTTLGSTSQQTNPH